MHKIHSSIKGASNLPISIDCTSIDNGIKKPLVIFCHGFKGFKDWGAWDLVANKFAQDNFIFLKFNFSHNGTSLAVKDDFVNLAAFSENNYSKELEDLQKVIDWVNSTEFPLKEQYNQAIFLVGHSRGGGAVLIKQMKEKSIVKTCTWASIDTYDRFGTEAQVEKWKQEGEHVFTNGRTGQKLPISYQFYTDYLQHIDKLDIKKAVRNNLKPLLIIHGTNDPAVNIESAHNLYSWSENSELIEIDGGNHVFGSRHPFLETILPSQLAEVVNSTIKFFKK